ncbi:alpha/beta hydrolase [Actimicrobium antarcticum]|uniref:Alpha/beta hydrolase n=1 Tax=Actimicrobium antarcticum TaxID=1051899 RepID=A0ABP7ST38_9BURK
MNLTCSGSGRPTVIFDSGMADWGFTWALVQPRIATTTRACTYDRAGLGYSDASHRTGDSTNMVDDLHRLLQQAAIPPPYVLVGHSLGGLNVRLFADRYRTEVSGMVLVDASHEDGMARIDRHPDGHETDRYRANLQRWSYCIAHPAAADFATRCIEPADPRYSAQLNAERARLQALPRYQQAQYSETKHYLDGSSFAAVRAARRYYGDMPLEVLTAGQTIASVGPEWLRLQRELAALSRRGVQITVAGAGHYIQLDRPATVSASIERVVAAARSEMAH